MRWTELEELQQRDLEFKIIVAQHVIRSAFETATRPALAFSGGKDSTVLLHLIRMTNPDWPNNLAVIYGNTGVEFPECVRFARRLADEWQLEFHEARPGKIEQPSRVSSTTWMALVATRRRTAWCTIRK